MTQRSLTEPDAVWVTWESFCCGGCGLHWAVDARWIAERRRDGKGFYCPNGCNRVFRETDAQRAEKRAQRAERERDAARISRDAARDQAAAAERRRAAAKGQLTKVKKRVAAGVCPCCSRSFQNLARHMSGQHPDYTAPPTPVVAVLARNGSKEQQK